MFVPREYNRDMAKIHVGTSGWYYPHWKHVFYPDDLPNEEKLHFYSDHFKTVEINNTFYHLPKKESVKNWYKQVGKDFIFSVKASRYISHILRLKEPEKSLGKFYESLDPLKEKLGPILIQLPPYFPKNLERLKAFVKHLRKKQLHVFEFRHDSWYEEEVYDVLRKHNISLCFTDLTGEISPQIVTADFAYFRLHGPKRYSGSYSEKEISSWKKMVLDLFKKKVSCYCYFDNDAKGEAVEDAKRLLEKVIKARRPL